MKIIYFITIYFFTLYGFSQECGTPTNSVNQDFTQIILGRLASYVNDGPYCINVKFHIVRKNDGTGGFDSSNIENLVSNLNQAYNPVNIFINNEGYDFINNTTYYDLTNSEFGDLITINNVSNAINFYLVNDFGSYAGSAENILSTNLVVDNSFAFSSTSSHEIGHCINLFHTHHGTWICERDSTTCIEIDNNNNSICGDYISDTPADPCLLPFDNNACSGSRSYTVNTSCAYNGDGGYNPDPSNIMSYSRKFCRTNFTQGQGQRMRDALQESTLLQQIISNSCEFIEIIGNDKICINNIYQYSIINATPPYNWTVSSNLEIIGSNTGSSVEIQSLNNQGGVGNIQVSYNGGSVPKNISIVIEEPIINVVKDDCDEQGVDCNMTIFDHEGQLITSVEWVKISGNANFTHNQSMFSINVGGGTQSWTFYGKATATNACGTFTDYFSVSGGGIHLDNVIPYPNSSNVNFDLDFSQLPPNTYYIEIYDMYSNVHYTGQSTNQEKTINTLDLLEGIYFLHLYDGINISIKQLIIEH